MLDILAKRHIHRLAEYASSNVLIGFDYDGTLAPIARRPELARMRPRTRRLLAAVARRYPCIVISGRARDDLERCLGTIPVWLMAGNHGLEPWGEDARYPARVKRWIARLERELRSYRGVLIEDKTYSVTVHYRDARPKAAVIAAVNRVAAGIRSARVIGGKQAISLVPRGAPHKGMALECARQLLACDHAIYAGDDETDEDVFGVTAAHRLLAIRVGRASASRAPYFLPGQEQVDALLQALIRFRPLRKAMVGAPATARRQDKIAVPFARVDR